MNDKQQIQQNKNFAYSKTLVVKVQNHKGYKDQNRHSSEP